MLKHKKSVCHDYTILKVYKDWAVPLLLSLLIMCQMSDTELKTCMQHSISSIYQLKWCTLKLIIAVLFQSHWEIENKLEVAEKCRWTRIDKIFPPIRMYNSRRVRSCWQNEWNPRWWYISTAVLIWKLLQEQNAAGVEFSRSRFEL